jgi:hypothetical protein
MNCSSRPFPRWRDAVEDRAHRGEFAVARARGGERRHLADHVARLDQLHHLAAVDRPR